MKLNLLFIILFVVSLSSCKKDQEIPKAVAGFSLGDETSSSVTVTEGTVIIPVNNSENASSYLWDFGNGTTSTEETPAISFSKGGDFTISLTATSKDGQTSITKKQVKVTVPVVRSITIKNLSSWVGMSTSTLKKFKGGDVWVEVYKPLSSGSYKQSPGGAWNYPLYYKSAVYKNVAASNAAPIVIAVPEKIALTGKIASKDFRYVFNLYVKDADGTHVLFTSDFVGSSFLPLANGSCEWASTFNNTQVAIQVSFE